jgi:hypothetical protein
VVPLDSQMPLHNLRYHSISIESRVGKCPLLCNDCAVWPQTTHKSNNCGSKTTKAREDTEGSGGYDASDSSVSDVRIRGLPFVVWTL